MNVKIKKTIWLSSLSLSLLFLLSGCVKVENGKPTGMVWNTIGRPMSYLIEYFANEKALGFGIAIILVTLIVRFLILPLGIYQSYKATQQSEKMRYLKPVLDPIQERMKSASSQEEQWAAQQELLATQKEYGVSMFGGLGCLPMFIQIPFFSALFFAARYTQGIAEANFMGINLGKASLILTAIAGLLYFAQSMLMQVGVDEAQKEQMKSMLLINPLLIVMFSWSSPAGVTLYWVVGGFFGILQQLLTTFIIKPKIRQQVEAAFAGKVLKPSKSSRPIKEATPLKTQPVKQPSKRNAGKQRTRK